MVHYMTDCVAGSTLASDVAIGSVLDVEVQPGRPVLDDFGRLVRLVRDNERLFSELEAVRSQARRAWSYFTEPGCNSALAIAQLDRLRMKRSALLAHLRANRVEARSLLGSTPPSDEDVELN